MSLRPSRLVLKTDRHISTSVPASGAISKSLLGTGGLRRRGRMQVAGESLIANHRIRKELLGWWDIASDFTSDRTGVLLNQTQVLDIPFAVSFIRRQSTASSSHRCGLPSRGYAL